MTTNNNQKEYYFRDEEIPDVMYECYFSEETPGEFTIYFDYWSANPDEFVCSRTGTLMKYSCEGCKFYDPWDDCKRPYKTFGKEDLPKMIKKVEDRGLTLISVTDYNPNEN